ncbi:unnamed protein product [Blumeria hordei]|uniref:FK506-binding protein n=2 Tax=Blumeria hordei TaxID=2867405 RepID=A0A383UTZ5_BLUHO|nr:FK506-binding protein [Blumeria hordei DH14]SZF03055.1 unnamed protein product [Blumeria hordei]
MPLLPVALYGLEVPCDGTYFPEEPCLPATFRITMAAIDPSESAENVESKSKTPSRSTLKIVREKRDPDHMSGEYMRALLADSGSSEDEDDDDETNGGPSDPQKSKKARKAEALQQLMESVSAEKSDDEMEDAPSKTKTDKGKSKAKDDEEDDDDTASSVDGEVEEFVLCTLDPFKNYQQPLDITISENENVFFRVVGTHNVFLTGNYVIPDDMEQGSNNYSDEDDYDLSPDDDELDSDSGEETDELDNIENPRIMEIDSQDEEEIPKQTKATAKKGKNKRPIDDASEENTLETLMAKSSKDATNTETKLSKKQQKKLKNNKGEAVEPKTVDPKKEDASKNDKGDKKVQFAKNLELGSKKTNEKTQSDASKLQKKASLGIKTVDGVKIDDKKLGTGRACKKGDKVSMRYIGKLSDGSVFDSNKKGTPFSFKLGTGEVIRGWDIGVMGMSPGGERRLTIPPNKAYGGKPLPGIPANSTLIFDIKLLEAK